MKLGLHCMDCVEGMAKMEAESVDLVITSPPYDNLRDYHNPDGWTFEKFKEVAQGISRVLRPGGIAVWITNDGVVNGGYTLTSFRHALYFIDNCALLMHQPLIWKKLGSRHPTKNRYLPCTEWMWVLSKGFPKTTNILEDRRNKKPGFKKAYRSIRNKDGSTEIFAPKPMAEFGKRFNVWEQHNGNGANQKAAMRGHPATFPEPLVADHIKSWSNAGDTVMDPFSGSGTVMRMAALLGRKFIGFEVSDEYCDLARSLQKRLLV